MGKTSNSVKTRYNARNYKQVKVSLKPDLFNEFKEFCSNNNLSYSEFIKLALEKLNKE